MPSKEEYWRDPEKHRAATKAYNQAHTDWKREANRAWMAKKRRENPEWARAESLKYRQKMTPEQKAERAEYQREWFAANPTYSKDKQREYHRLRPARRMAHGAKIRARHLGVPFDLEWRDIVVPENCPALGIKLEPGDGVQIPASPSLDRLVPSLGYTKTNTRVISQAANIIKKDRSLSEMEAYAERLRSRLKNAELVIAYMRRELG